MSRVLVIDSSNIFIRYVELIVVRYGYHVSGVRSAMEALNVLSHERVDLILAQENLPDMEWEEFCRRVRTETGRTGVPVVILSSKSGEYGGEICEGVIVAEVKKKPISMRDLITVLREQLPLKTKRKVIRAPLTMRAFVREKRGLRPCQILNLSEGGAFIFREKLDPVGTVIQLILPLAGIKKPLKVRGKVTYVNTHHREGKPRGMGVRFTDLSPETEELLRVHLGDYVSGILGIRHELGE